ncbi:hypothetical protein V1508DRAFT_435128 [Lipomyces doorenjongii]|uniref:uncharacterized protein n=1 Tax=Lipomyces doorenjongii TaxID=383834 RepID=UPI0034CD7F4F
MVANKRTDTHSFNFTIKTIVATSFLQMRLMLLENSELARSGVAVGLASAVVNLSHDDYDSTVRLSIKRHRNITIAEVSYMENKSQSPSIPDVPELCLTMRAELDSSRSIVPNFRITSLVSAKPFYAALRGLSDYRLMIAHEFNVNAVKPGSLNESTQSTILAIGNRKLIVVGGWGRQWVAERYFSEVCLVITTCKHKAVQTNTISNTTAYNPGLQ